MIRNSKLAYFFAGAIVALVSSAATSYVNATAVAAKQKGIKKGSHVNLSPEDYLEIVQLINEYPRDVDAGAVRDASWMFSKDARSTGMTGGAPMTTPQDHKHFYSALVGPNGQAKKGGNRHFNASPVIIGLPDGTARGSSYMMGVSIKEKGGKPTIDLMGKYEDVYVKTPDGWRMKERIWTSDQFVGSYQDVAPSPVLADQSTWTTRTNTEIEQLWSQGLKRDASGAPINPRPGTPEAPVK
jgi:hypothetical protein